jgi:hypothetical protein
MARSDISSLTRRRLLGAGAAIVAATAVSSRTSAQAAKFRRWEITDPAMPPRVLASYKDGIKKMLSLPPADPRNWYRNAMLHLFDCPHGNWWFLAWHRAYLGWLEVTLRDLSGDPEFALPYWDWTKTPRVPAAMFADVLDPNNGAFISTFDQFKTHFEPAVNSVYKAFSQAQNDALALRPGFDTVQGFWQALPGIFFDQPNARGLTATNPDLDGNTQVAVAIGTIRSALRTNLFAGSGDRRQPAGFQSAKADNHSSGSVKGILESQPHDNVHVAMGGGGDCFMVEFYSPVDPIFFLHHGNLDRLWEVWTRRQAALGRPTMPQGADLTKWSNEQFLFFTDAQGQPVSKIKAGDYATTSVFDYDYSKGSGDEPVSTPGPIAAAAPQIFEAQVASAAVGAATAAGGIANVSAAALQAADSRQVAEITLNLTHADQGRRFRVLVSPGGGAAPVAAGAISVFGHPHDGPMTFTVPLPDGLGAATAAGGQVPLDIRVVPIGGAPRATAAAAAAGAPAPLVNSILVRTD